MGGQNGKKYSIEGERRLNIDSLVTPRGNYFVKSSNTGL